MQRGAMEIAERRDGNRRETLPAHPHVGRKRSFSTLMLDARACSIQLDAGMHATVCDTVNIVIYVVECGA